MASNRDFLYIQRVVKHRAFLSDDGRIGLHLTRSDGEAFDVSFAPRTIPVLQKSLHKALQMLADRKERKA